MPTLGPYLHLVCIKTYAICNLCRCVSEGIMGFFVLSKELRRASEGIMGFFVLSKEWSLEFKSRVSENSRKTNPR